MNSIELSRPKLMANLQDDFQIVVIDGFYDLVNREDARTWLGKLFQFKVNSYLAHYPYGIMPFVQSDLVGTHWILCKKNGSGNIQPIMGLKTIDSNRTEAFRMEFPAFWFVNGPELESHRMAI